MDFVSDSLGTGRRIRILTVLDLWGRSNPALKVDISLSSQRVVQVLERLCLQGRLPRRVHTDNGPEFMGRALDEWAREHGVDMEYSRPGKPTDNGFVESFNERERETPQPPTAAKTEGIARQQDDNNQQSQGTGGGFTISPDTPLDEL